MCIFPCGMPSCTRIALRRGTNRELEHDERRLLVRSEHRGAFCEIHIGECAVRL